MLTKKELLNYKKTKGHIVPKFISNSEESLIKLADNYIEVFSAAIGLVQSELDEQIAVACVDSLEVEQIVQKGLLKLLNDRLTFESFFTGDINELRQNIFKAANCFLSDAVQFSLSAYLEKVAKSVHLSVKEIQPLLYSDLPEHNRIIAFKEINAKNLLNRYNLALVQGLLFYSEAVTIEIPTNSSAKAELRFLLRQIKFYQLVVHIQKENDKLIIHLDGPISLFMQTQKYGFNLAAFFPVIVLLPKWELHAKIEISKSVRQQGLLTLNQNSPLISHYRNFSAYIPEDFKIFEEQFQLKSTQWVIDNDSENILFDGNNYFFPDYKFVNADKIVYLELFHAWHKRALLQRIINIKSNYSFSYIIGIAKSLLKDKEISQSISTSDYFNKNGFIFREIPTTKQVLDILRKFE